MKINRRDILIGSAALMAGARLPALAASAPRRYSIGHTGITWGYAPENAAQAIQDVASLGYHAFESFGSVIEYWEEQGGIGALLEQHGVDLVGAYCPMILTDAAVRAEEVEKIQRWGSLIKKYGGSIAVIGPDNVDRSAFNYAESRTTIIDSLNALGSALQDVGITGALHQHTGSCIETPDETYDVMASVNTDVVKLCPDTGEMLAGGVDPVKAVSDFLDVIAHVHIKDWNEGPTNDGYCPVGEGRVDVAAVIEVLETASHDFMIMAELNPGNPNASALELATRSKATFVELGYSFQR